MVSVSKQQAQPVNAGFLGMHVLGDFPIFQRSQVDRHLSKCSARRDRLRYVARVIAAFAKEPAQPAARRHSSPRNLWDRPGAGL